MSQVTNTRTRFRAECTVTCAISASPEKVWQLLTDVPGYLEWNSTLVSFTGDISLGGFVSMEVPEAPGQVFKVKVTEFTPRKSMLWVSGFAPMFIGRRSFALASDHEQMTYFTMSEVFAGLMLPLAAKRLPDFQPIFHRYADDLKVAAEG
jgi:hypothetical protein